jgi:hypothetical protein
MRKVVFAAAVLVLSANLSLAGTVVKGSFDFKGKMKVGSVDFDVEQSFSVAGEHYLSLHDFVEVGLGGEYQFHRGIEGSSGTFHFVPVYGCVRVSPLNLPVIDPYAAARVGYNFFFGDDDFTGGWDTKGGICYGFGAGTRIMDFLIVEGMYTVNNGTMSSGGSEMELKYSKFSAYAGVEF